MQENLNFQLISELDINDLKQSILVIRKKQSSIIKVALIINMFFLLIGLIIELYKYFVEGSFDFTFMALCLFFLILLSLIIINLNKLQLIAFKKHLDKNKNLYNVQKLCFYDNYYTIEFSKDDVSANITISYEDVNCFVVDKNLVVFGDKTKDKSLIFIRKNAKFEIGTLEEFLQFFNKKISA